MGPRSASIARAVGFGFGALLGAVGYGVFDPLAPQV